MRNKYKNILLYVMLIAGILYSLSGFNANTVVKAAVPVSAEYNFKSQDQMEDFYAVTTKEENSVDGVIVPVFDYWTLDAKAGKIISKRTGSGTGSTGNVLSLVLKKYTFTNFYAEIVMSYEGDSSWGWGGLQFRKQKTEMGWRSDGCFAFAQREGHATLWGDDSFDNTVTESKNSLSFDKNAPFLLTIRLVGKNCVVKVQSKDKSTTYAEVDYVFKKNASIKDGYIMLQSVDNSHAFYSLKVTNLDESGNEIPLNEIKRAESIKIEDKAERMVAGRPCRLELTDKSINKNDVGWRIADGEAIVKDGWVTALKKGNVTVRAFLKSDTEVYDDKIIEFESPEDIFTAKDFSSFKILCNNGNAGEEGREDKNGNNWIITEENYIRRCGIETATDSATNFNFLYPADKNMKNFEATLVYRNTDGRLGWIGVTSGTQFYGRRCIEDGVGFFVQKEGKPTIWGKETGLFECNERGYDVDGWHVLQVKVYGKEAEIYIDGMDEPVMKKTFATGFSKGHVGIMTTGSATFDIASFSIDLLNEKGNKIDLSGIEAVTIKNKISSAAVGDKSDLEYTIKGEYADNIDFGFVISDTNVAFENEGILYFIAPGQVTVKLICLSDSRFTDTMTVTVKGKEAEKEYTYTEETEENNSGNDIKNGCKAFLGNNMLPAVLTAAISALFIRRKRR